MNISTTNWIAPKGIRLPDFILCGAMKSGTSTLHYILNQHPHIFIPVNEIYFFDIDNILEHPDFNFFDGNDWYTQRLEDNPAIFWNWYSSHFIGAAENQIIGEDSTTYLTSEIAAKRIMLQEKKIKLIIMLRHPTARAYSQYWHMVRTGRATYSFENTIRYEPHSVLYRSLYYEQLKNIFKHVPQKQVKVIIFEEFLMNKCVVLEEICTYIGVDYNLLPTTSIDSHKNKGLTPKYPSVHIFKNGLFREQGNLHYLSHLPVKLKPALGKKINAKMMHIIEKTHSKINPIREATVETMNASTKNFLDVFFKRELDGINDLLGKDVMSLWFD